MIPQGNEQSEDSKKPDDKVEESEEEEEDGPDGTDSVTLFDELARVLYSTMRNGSNKYVKVKHLAVFTIFPKLVNLSLSFLDESISLRFLKMLVRAS